MNGSKFTNPSPKLPDMYILWRDLAQVEHKLEPFARGDRTPAAVHQAREALDALKAAQWELNATSVFIVETLKTLDAQHDQAFESWAEQVDRPDLVVPVEGPNGEQFTATYKATDSGAAQFDTRVDPNQQTDTPHYFHTRPEPMSETDSRCATAPDPHVDPDQGIRPYEKIYGPGDEPIAYRDSDGQPRANADALVGHARRFMDDTSPDCYNCGHAKSAHPTRQGGLNVGGGCGSIVEHGYRCDCLGYTPGQPRPVAEVEGRPVGYREFSGILDELDNEQPDPSRRIDVEWVNTVREDGKADPHECWTCSHGDHQHGPWGCNGGGKDGCQCQQFQEASQPE